MRERERSTEGGKSKILKIFPPFLHINTYIHTSPAFLSSLVLSFLALFWDNPERKSRKLLVLEVTNSLQIEMGRCCFLWFVVSWLVNFSVLGSWNQFGGWASVDFWVWFSWLEDWGTSFDLDFGYFTLSTPLSSFVLCYKSLKWFTLMVFLVSLFALLDS